MSEPKIKRKGNSFEYYNEKGLCIGTISIKTKKFIGVTSCMLELHKHLEEYKKTPEYKEDEKKRLEKSLKESTDKFHRDLEKLESL